MTDERISRVAPLRSGDTRQLSVYTLIGRLGEGGMGSVFLAQLPDGQLVAVKMIRAELADDPGFRRRFRGEVDRARQVPPFCTAEVLDADPDHDPPYLVVEYVDAPSLAAVVKERGPLTPANLYGLAIGVATALTAIHGAGVIHRDLKPSNVLLAPGSPKVIDFGIARAMHTTTTANTATDQVVGSVPYMAPERFEPGDSGAITAAADIFAWGAVIAYAGTGRIPFAGELPQAVAYQILTNPPNLDGLSGPLRGLVEYALTKDPAGRPTARQLLDSLLTNGARSSHDAATALARQPALRIAAEGAQAAIDQGLPPLPRPTTPSETLVAARSDPPLAVPRSSRAKTVTLALAGLLMSATVASLVSGAILLNRSAHIGQTTDSSRGASSPTMSDTGSPSPTASPTPTASLSPSPSASAAPAPSVPAGAFVSIDDPLTRELYWRARDDKANKTTCTFDNGLLITTQNSVPYRCPGPRDQQGAVSVFVDVTLSNPGSCAGVWFRYSDNAGGYVLRICPDGYHLWAQSTTGAQIETHLHDILFADKVSSGTTVRVGLYAQDKVLQFYRDGVLVGMWQDTTFSLGRVVLGIYPDTATNDPPYAVRFAHIEIWTAAA